MNPLTGEWISKAEGDYNTALREVRARRKPNYDSACFHAQQLAEKYLKAFLQENGLDVPHSHNLAELVTLCMQIDASFTLIEPDLKALDVYAVRVRYPGLSATREEAVLSVKLAGQVRAFIRMRLPPGEIIT